jgi:hypothetical protein
MQSIRDPSPDWQRDAVRNQNKGAVALRLIAPSGPLSRLMRPMAERAWARAGKHGDRAFLVIASSYWNEPRISQHDVARTFARQGPTIFLEPTWIGNRRKWDAKFNDDGPTVIAGPAIPRGVRFRSVAQANLMLGLAAWRALAETAPPDRQLVTWVLEFRFAPVLEFDGYRPPFVFHNVDVQTDGQQEARMARLATLCACSSSAAAELVGRSNPHTMTIGHGISRETAELAAQAAAERRASPAQTGTVGFVGYWSPHVHIDMQLVRRMLSTYPDLILEVTTPAETIVDLSSEFPGRVRPLGFLSWPEILRRTVHWDAAVIPYDGAKPVIYYSCPYKVPPLLSAALPVICVDIPAIRRLAPHLHLAGNAEEFIALTGRALRGELRVDPADASAFRAERAWDRVLGPVVSAYAEAAGDGRGTYTTKDHGAGVTAANLGPICT